MFNLSLTTIIAMVAVLFVGFIVIKFVTKMLIRLLVAGIVIAIVLALFFNPIGIIRGAVDGSPGNQQVVMQHC